MLTDTGGRNTFATPFNCKKYSTTLSLGIAQTITVPAEYSRYIAIFAFEPGAMVWVADNETAAVPGSSFAETTSFLNPVAKLVKGEDVLSLITNSDSAEVGVSFYDIP